MKRKMLIKNILEQNLREEIVEVNSNELVGTYYEDDPFFEENDQMIYLANKYGDSYRRNINFLGKVKVQYAKIENCYKLVKYGEYIINMLCFVKNRLIISAILNRPDKKIDLILYKDVYGYEVIKNKYPPSKESNFYASYEVFAPNGSIILRVGAIKNRLYILTHGFLEQFKIYLTKRNRLIDLSSIQLSKMKKYIKEYGKTIKNVQQMKFKLEQKHKKEELKKRETALDEVLILKTKKNT